MTGAKNIVRYTESFYSCSVEVRYAERFHCSAKCCFFLFADASKIGILGPFRITNDVIMTSLLLLKGLRFTVQYMLINQSAIFLLEHAVSPMKAI